MLKPHGTSHLKLKCGMLLSTFAFNFKLRRYIMGLGHGLLAAHPVFLLGMLLIALGNGCFKPNISTRAGAYTRAHFRST